MVTEVRFERTESVAATTDIDREIQLVTFKLDNQEYALDIANVVQVVRMVATTPMPEAPKIVRGVINVRGKVIPDLREIPIVLVTALESREDKERGIEVGADAYIVKSTFDQKTLLDAVEQLI